jgi:hypothetical protein
MSALASVVSDETGPYRPSDDEPFMSERQLAYFKKKLLDWKDDILRESKGTVVNLKAETENHPDLVDRASSESDRALELRTDPFDVRSRLSGHDGEKRLRQRVRIDHRFGANHIVPQ